MPPENPLALYKKYYIDRDYERLDLFQQLAKYHNIQSALYPGSFVHITPSLVYPKTVYVDNDRQAKKFFALSVVFDFVSSHKLYEQEPSITFHPQSYTDDFGEEDESFDLLISQYAGFVSLYCAKYLKIGGLLLANNSHGDVSMASISDQFELVAVVNRRSGKHTIIESNLESYLVPKSDQVITREYLQQIQRGIGYKKSASMYIFRRNS
ncbi:MAG: hypothetical protein K8F91_17380 [Candidatus Obscuribacterales bacterium]|nr:hypothetical protein [Candidatus Obscuribacterales bacterium]